MRHTERILLIDDEAKLLETKCADEEPVFSIRYGDEDVFEPGDIKITTRVFMDEFTTVTML